MKREGNIDEKRENNHLEGKNSDSNETKKEPPEGRNNMYNGYQHTLMNKQMK